MDTKKKFRYWRKRILFSVWITYAAFYLCRVNISVAMPGIMAEFGISKTAMGGVLTALFIVYAIGQFVNGQLGDKFNTRYFVSIGILFSAIINLIFGFTNGTITAMLLLWGLNGWFQSMGWAPSVKTIANWFPPKQRGRVGGIMGTSYQIGNAVTWALSGFIVGLFGWRWAFWIPGMLFILFGIHWFVRARNAPEEVGLPTIEEESNGIENAEKKKDHHLGFIKVFKMVVTKKRVWVVALGLFFVNIIRYGFIGWAPTYMFEVQGASISVAAYKAIAFPLAGSLGAIWAGWMSDRVFKGRRAPVCVIMLLFLALFSWLYPQIPAGDWILSLVYLLVIGFMTFGPHVLMVGIMPMDYATRKAASAATGFIDGWGYIGSALAGVGTGFLVDNFSWNTAFNFWVLSAVIAAILMSFLWNYGAVKR